MNDRNTVNRYAPHGNTGEIVPEWSNPLTTVVQWTDCAALNTPGLRFGAYDPAELQRADNEA